MTILLTVFFRFLFWNVVYVYTIVVSISHWLVGWLVGGAAAGASATADDGSTALVSLTFFAFELEKVGKSFHRDIFSSSSSLDFHDFHDFWFFAICTAICHKIILILSNSKATVIIYYNYIHLLYLLVN